MKRAIRMERLQIKIKPRQMEALRLEGERTQSAVSEVVRRALDEYIERCAIRPQWELSKPSPSLRSSPQGDD